MTHLVVVSAFHDEDVALRGEEVEIAGGRCLTHDLHYYYCQTGWKHQYYDHHVPPRVS